MAGLKWNRPKYRTEGKATEHHRGYGDHVPGRPGRRQAKRSRKTVLSDGTVVDGALTYVEVLALEAEREDKG